MVRTDSGFATPVLYEHCEEYDSLYTIRLKSNRNLYRIAEQFVAIKDNHDWDKHEVHYYNATYQATSWTQARRFCIISTREASELPFRHEFISTDFSKDVSPEIIFQTYSKRRTMENYIKEAKK